MVSWDLLWWYFSEYVWEILLSFVTLAWGEIRGWLDRIIGWWATLWNNIETVIDNADNWLQEQISSIKYLIWVGDYLAWELIERSVNTLRAIVDGLVENATQWLSEQVDAATAWFQALVDGAIAFAQDLVDTATAWLLEQIDQAIAWVLDGLAWIEFYEDLITVWLTDVKDFIDWLWITASSQLIAFLADPMGFVLGLLATSLVDLLNWWATFGGGLMDFVVSDLPALRNLLVVGLEFLLTLVDRPAETILELLTATFLGWLEQLIADNW